MFPLLYLYFFFSNFLSPIGNKKNEKNEKKKKRKEKHKQIHPRGLLIRCGIKREKKIMKKGKKIKKYTHSSRCTNPLNLITFFNKSSHR